ELAFHFTRSGDRERGTHYALQAGEYALSHSAVDDALALFQAALDLLDPADGQYCPTLMRLGETALLAGKERVAAEAYQEARTRCLERGDRAAAARSTHGLGLALFRQDLQVEAKVTFEAALALLRGYQGPET